MIIKEDGEGGIIITMKDKSAFASTKTVHIVAELQWKIDYGHGGGDHVVGVELKIKE